MGDVILKEPLINNRIRISPDNPKKLYFRAFMNSFFSIVPLMISHKVRIARNGMATGDDQVIETVLNLL
jgi:hypothetical protein